MTSSKSKKIIKAWAIIADGEIAACECHAYGRKLFQIFPRKKDAEKTAFKGEKVIPITLTL